MAYVSLASSYAFTIRNQDPARAHALYRSDGRITALASQKALGIDGQAADRRMAVRLARLALRQDPTAVQAVATLGIDAQFRGDVRRSRVLFAYAQKLSRRDLQTQIWAIEDAVGRGDIAGALNHYDIALRTSRGAPDLLYPILGSAIADPAVRAALVRTLRTAPVWRASFIDYVSGNGVDPRATASLFAALRRVDVKVPQGADAAIVSALMARGMIDAAWDYYHSIYLGTDRRTSRDPRFAATNEIASPFDWEAISDGGVTASIQRTARDGLLDFSAPSGNGGAVLQQVQLLPPGRYQLDGHSMGVDQPSDSAPYWALNCRDGRELGRIVVPNSSMKGGHFRGIVDVPASCPVQTLVLIIRPSDAVAGVTGQIDRARLAPAGQE